MVLTLWPANLPLRKPPVELGISLVPCGPVKEFVDRVRLAEELGFDSAWIGEVGLHHDVIACLALAARETGRIKLGLGCTNPYIRHPALLAAALASLEEVAPKRIILALGAGGYSMLLPLGIATWNRPFAAISEAVAVIRSLLRGKSISYQGHHYRLRRARLLCHTQAQVPIIIAAMGPKMVNLAAQVGNGVLLGGPLGPFGMRVLRQLQRLDRRGNGWPLTVAIDSITCVASKRRTAYERARPYIGRYILADPRFLPAMSEAGIGARVHVEARERLRKRLSLSPLVDDRMVGLFSVSGTPRECVRKIKQLGSAGINHFIFGRPYGRNFQEGLRLFAQEVIPALRTTP